MAFPLSRRHTQALPSSEKFPRFTKRQTTFDIDTLVKEETSVPKETREPTHSKQPTMTEILKIPDRKVSNFSSVTRVTKMTAD